MGAHGSPWQNKTEAWREYSNRNDLECSLPLNREGNNKEGANIFAEKAYICG